MKAFVVYSDKIIDHEETKNEYYKIYCVRTTEDAAKDTVIDLIKRGRHEAGYFESILR